MTAGGVSLGRGDAKAGASVLLSELSLSRPGPQRALAVVRTVLSAEDLPAIS